MALLAKEHFHQAASVEEGLDSEDEVDLGSLAAGFAPKVASYCEALLRSPGSSLQHLCVAGFQLDSVLFVCTI
jgi:hypothetical protein